MARLSEEEILENMRKYFENQKKLIAKHGWAIAGVFSTQENPGPNFAYTVGLSFDKEFKLPELIMTGLRIEHMQTLLNDVAKALTTAGKDGPGMVGHKFVTPKVANLETRFYDVSDHPDIYKEFVTQPRNHRGDTDYKVFQVVWPDDNSIFPWEHGFNPKFLPSQPLITERPLAS